MEKAYAVWRAFQDRFLAHAAALVLLGATLLALVEVVRRYVFGFSYEWQQDAVTFFTLSAIYLFFGISQRRGGHLSVTLLVESLDAMGPRARRAAEVIRLLALVFTFVFLLAVVWWGFPEVEDAFRYESRTESLAFPMAPFLVALIVGFMFMAVSVFFQIYREFHKLRGRTVLEEPELEEKLH
jgi:TRAP-type C4-dicarboxylate transport system permease small subunit